MNSAAPEAAVPPLDDLPIVIARVDAALAAGKLPKANGAWKADLAVLLEAAKTAHHYRTHHNKLKRPFSDRLAQQIIASQLKIIDGLRLELAEAQKAAGLGPWAVREST